MAMSRIERWIVWGGLAALLGLAFLFAAQRGLAQGGWKLIVHPSVTVDAVSREQLARLYLKKGIRWSDGRSAVPVDQSEGSAVRAAFTRDVLAKTPNEVKSYWQQQIFTGRAAPPAVRGSDAEVVRFVAQTSGAVGYVSAAAEVRDVKVVDFLP